MLRIVNRNVYNNLEIDVVNGGIMEILVMEITNVPGFPKILLKQDPDYKALTK